MREEAKKRKIAEKKKKKRMLEYLQQLWDEILVEDAAFLKSTEEFQIVGFKCKEISPEDNMDC